MPQCRRTKEVAGGVETCVLEHRHTGSHRFDSDGKTTGVVKITAKFQPGADMRAIRFWLQSIPAGGVKKVGSLKRAPRR